MNRPLIDYRHVYHHRFVAISLSALTLSSVYLTPPSRSMRVSSVSTMSDTTSCKEVEGILLDVAGGTDFTSYLRNGRVFEGLRKLVREESRWIQVQSLCPGELRVWWRLKDEGDAKSAYDERCNHIIASNSGSIQVLDSFCRSEGILVSFWQTRRSNEGFHLQSSHVLPYSNSWLELPFFIM